MLDNRVFVYETLKRRGIREQALGSDVRNIKVISSVVKNFKEEFVVQGTERWPTLCPDHKAETKGDVGGERS